MMGPKIVIEPPGPKAKEVLEKNKEYLVTTTQGVPYVVIKRGRGIFVEDVDGNVYIDFASGIGVLNTGHTPEPVINAIKEQIDKFIHFSLTDFYYEIPLKLAEELFRITPGNHKKKVFYGNSGTEANEAALKVAKYYTNRPYIIAFIGAFHGRTMGSLSLTASKPVHKRRFFPMMPGVVHVPYPSPYRPPFGYEGNDLGKAVVDYIRDFVFEKFVPPDEVAAIFVEPIQGEGGYVVPPRDFFPELRKLANEYGIILVDDEVQMGMGRTGKWWAIENFGIVPDIITSAKALASGMPLGATIIRAEYDFPESGSHATTFGGNPVSCAAAIATIKMIEERNLLENARKQGEYLHKRLRELQEKYEQYIGDVRGIGLAQAIEIVKDSKTKEYYPELRGKIVEEASKLGLILLGCGKSAIRFIPPLIVEKEHIDVAIEILEKAIARAIEAVK